MITFEEKKPAIQLDFMDHLMKQAEEVKDLPTLLEMSKVFDQLLMWRPTSRGFKQTVQVRAHQRRI